MLSHLRVLHDNNRKRRVERLYSKSIFLWINFCCTTCFVSVYQILNMTRCCWFVMVGLVSQGKCVKLLTEYRLLIGSDIYGLRDTWLVEKRHLPCRWPWVTFKLIHLTFANLSTCNLSNSSHSSWQESSYHEASRGPSVTEEPLKLGP